MTSEAVVKEIAPKRKRMMDMILALGGLKEEASIPLSKVNEEITQLKRDISPLTSDIIEFPDKYFEEFFAVAEQSNISSQVKDKAIITEGVSNLQDALEIWNSSGVSSLLELFKITLASFEEIKETDDTKTDVDVSVLLKPLPELATTIESIVGEYEENSKKDANAALQNLKRLFSHILMVHWI